MTNDLAYCIKVPITPKEFYENLLRTEMICAIKNYDRIRGILAIFNRRHDVGQNDIGQNDTGQVSIVTGRWH